MKSDIMAYNICAEFELLIHEIHRCTNHPEKYSTSKIGKKIPCRYSMSAIWTFDNIENNHALYRGEDCMKHFLTSFVILKNCYRSQKKS